MHEHGRLFTALLQRDTVKTLSFTDPWGTLVALGAKRIETRSWTTMWRGPVAIHIARRLPDDLETLCQQPHFHEVLATDYSHDNQWHFPTGHIIAIVHLDEVQRTEHVQPTEQERAFGNFAAGRYAWQFGTVYHLPQPVPARGSLGLWDWQPPLAFWERIQQAHDMASVTKYKEQADEQEIND